MNYFMIIAGAVISGFYSSISVAMAGYESFMVFDPDQTVIDIPSQEIPLTRDTLSQALLSNDADRLSMVEKSWQKLSWQQKKDILLQIDFAPIEQAIAYHQNIDELRDEREDCLATMISCPNAAWIVGGLLSTTIGMIINSPTMVNLSLGGLFPAMISLQLLNTFSQYAEIEDQSDQVKEMIRQLKEQQAIAQAMNPA